MVKDEMVELSVEVVPVIVLFPIMVPVVVVPVFASFTTQLFIVTLYPG